MFASSNEKFSKLSEITQISRALAVNERNTQNIPLIWFSFKSFPSIIYEYFGIKKIEKINIEKLDKNSKKHNQKLRNRYYCSFRVGYNSGITWHILLYIFIFS